MTVKVTSQPYDVSYISPMLFVQIVVVRVNRSAEVDRVSVDMGSAEVDMGSAEVDMGSAEVDRSNAEVLASQIRWIKCVS